MNIKVCKKKIKYVILGLVLSCVIFLGLLLSGKIQYGDVIEKYADSEIYGVYANRELHMGKGDVLEQNLIKGNGQFNSFSLKYHMELFSPGLQFDIELCNAKTGDVLENWIENGENIGEDGFGEYIFSKSDTKLYNDLLIRITANKENNALYCSNVDSSHGVDFKINGIRQEGDLILRLTQKKYILNTVIWGVICSSILGMFLSFFIGQKMWKKIHIVLHELIEYLKNNIKTILKYSIGVTLIILISYVIEKILSSFNILAYNTIGAFNEYRFIFICAGLLSAYVFIRMLGLFKKKPECVFATLLLIIGVMYVVIMPSQVEVSWDESIHYWNAVGVSHALDGKTNVADDWIYWHSGVGYTLPNSIDNLRTSQNQIQALYDTQQLTASNTDILSKINVVAYIPSAIGLVIGRILNLPQLCIFHLGAAMNMLLYVALTYFSMKQLKSGKMILSTVACLTTSVFLASVYSTDSWIIGFSMLGFSTFLGTMQEESKITNRKLIVMLVSFTLAFMPKAIYSPLLLLYMLIPQEKFENEKQCELFRITTLSLFITLFLEMIVSFKLFIFIMGISWLLSYFVYMKGKKLSKNQLIVIAVVCCILLLIVGYLGARFVLPLMLGQGDMRGGKDVNSAEQVRVILNHPWGYCKILGRYLLTNYLNYQGALQIVFKTFGYLGEASFGAVSFALLWIVSFTDKNNNDMWKRYNMYKISICIIDAVLIILIPTALYISFTPIGYETINGCQPRYLLPLFSGFFLVVGSNRIRNGVSSKAYNGMVVGVNMLLLLLSAWEVVVRFYY